jgi:pimeloyl-ACP methyl ester carboxylesterase
MFEERRAAHRAMAEFASALSDRGIAVLHPDLAGCGNSPGSLRDATLAQWDRNIQESLAWVQNRANGLPIHFTGCRLGALLAAWYLSVHPGDASRTLLWNPVAAGGAYLSAARKRRMIQDSMTDAEGRPSIDPLEVEGQVLSKALYEELGGLDLTRMPPPAGARIFQCSFNTKPTAEAQRLGQAWGGNVPIHCVVAPPFWNAHTPAGYDEVVSNAMDSLLQ